MHVHVSWMCKHDGIFYVKNDKENVMKAFQSLNFVVNHVNQKDRERMVWVNIR